MLVGGEQIEGKDEMTVLKDCSATFGKCTMSGCLCA